MKIWRVETADGVGPYQGYSGKTEDQMAFTKAILDWMDENEKRVGHAPDAVKGWHRSVLYGTLLRILLTGGSRIVVWGMDGAYASRLLNATYAQCVNGPKSV